MHLLSLPCIPWLLTLVELRPSSVGSKQHLFNLRQAVSQLAFELQVLWAGGHFSQCKGGTIYMDFEINGVP